METVIRRRWQGGEEAELMTVTACFIRDASRTVSPPSGLCSNTPISLLPCERHRHCRRLPPPATACNLDDTFSLKKFAKKCFHPANGCSETFSSGHLSSPSSAASSKLEKQTVKKRREGLTLCQLLLLLVAAAAAAGISHCCNSGTFTRSRFRFFFSKEDQKTTTTKQKKCRLKFFQQRKCVFIQLLTGFDKSCSGKLAASRKNAKLQTLQRLRKVLLDVREFPLHVFWMLLLLFSSSCSMDVETAGLKV